MRDLTHEGACGFFDMGAALFDDALFDAARERLPRRDFARVADNMASISRQGMRLLDLLEVAAWSDRRAIFEAVFKLLGRLRVFGAMLKEPTISTAFKDSRAYTPGFIEKWRKTLIDTAVWFYTAHVVGQEADRADEEQVEAFRNNAFTHDGALYRIDSPIVKFLSEKLAGFEAKSRPEDPWAAVDGLLRGYVEGLQAIILKQQELENIGGSVSCFDYVAAFVEDSGQFGIVIYVEPCGHIGKLGRTWLEVLDWWISVFKTEPRHWDYITAGWHLYSLACRGELPEDPAGIWATREGKASSGGANGAMNSVGME